MSNTCTYLCEKIYPNGDKVLSVKNGIDVSTLTKIPKQNKFINSNSQLDNSPKSDNSIKLVNLKRSARRVYSVVRDLCLCNTFTLFLTLTFTSDKSTIEDRMNDDITRQAFQDWRKDVKVSFPNMRYIAVPEYHKKGGLHYHLLLGGITLAELQAEYLKDVNCMGQIIPLYKANVWKSGFSSVSEIVCPEACHKYVMKYITKADLDIRFHNKKRYHCSHNLVRPTCNRNSFVGGLFDEHYTLDVFQNELCLEKDYADKDNHYYVFKQK